MKSRPLNRARTDLSGPEPLEPRIAPAAVFTYTDVDGDKITVHSNKGNNSDLQNIFQKHAVFQNLGYRVNEVDFTDVPPANFGEFSGANITISVTRGPHGDGHVDLGTITSGTMPLGSFIASKASIQAIDCGDGTHGIGTLVVDSYGTAAPSYFNSGITDALGVINGSVGSIKIAGDIAYGGIQIGKFGVTNTFTARSIHVGGSLNGAVSGATAHAGELIVLASSIGSITVKGSVIGGSIGASVITGDGSGFLFSDTESKSVAVGDIIGGSASSSGSVQAFAGSITVNGSIIGGSNFGAGLLYGGAKVLVVKGSIVGGTSPSGVNLPSGGINLIDPCQVMSISGNVIAGLASSGGQNFNGSIIAGDNTGTIHIGGSIVGNNSNRVLILVAGNPHPNPAQEFNAIGSMTVGGSVEYAVIASGHENTGTTDLGNATFANAGIGSVTIEGDFYHSSILAGTNDNNAIGAGRIVGGVNQDTQSIGTPGNLATLGAVVIKGSLLNDINATGDSGFEAAVIKSITVGGNIVFQHGQGLTYFDPNDFVFADEITPT